MDLNIIENFDSKIFLVPRFPSWWRLQRGTVNVQQNKLIAVLREKLEKYANVNLYRVRVKWNKRSILNVVKVQGREEME